MTVFLTEQIMFVHVPKTAGTTVRQFIESHFAPDAIFPSQAQIDVDPHIYHNMQRIRQSQTKHIHNALLVRGHITYHEILPLLASPPITLTMLRNPVRRALSEIYHHRRHSDPYFKTLPLEDIVRDHPNIYRQQWMYFGETLDDAIQTMHGFDWVGIQEIFEPSMQSLCAMLGWKTPSSWKQENKMPKEQEESISLGVLDMLHERLQDDIEFYVKARRWVESKTSDLRKRVA